ncbi:outward-rectifier potassium channel TOK1 [Naviculisporaceae sp. PSN 640]
MNDASGDKLDEHVRAADPGADQLPKESEHDGHDQDHLDPSRWWFASAAFPMVAGTLGPVASAFSICALVRPWRQAYGPGIDITDAPFIPDPPWLTIVNAIQLVIALGANFALLLNMARRLRFSIAQPLTIVGWYVSAITLMALTSTASGPLVIEPQDSFVWSQAFFYGIYSTVLYFAVASLMLVTFAGAQAGRYEKDFMLTPSQRTLMLQTISFLTYILLGALVFSHVEDWNYLNAMYWAAVTLFTVGFGDIYPETPLGRALLFPYALIGIISLGLVIGSIRSLILQRGKHRMDARMMERKRRKILRRITMQGQDEILVPIREETSPSLRSADATGLTEFERREQEFKLMRKIQHAAARRRRWYAMAVSGTTWVVLWLVGAKIFQATESKWQGWNYFDGVYFAFVSLTTIGYGDIVPVSNAGRSFWVFWAFLALPTTTVLISNAGDTIVKFIRDTTDEIATLTILPGERGFRKDFRKFLRKLSCGTLFEEDVEETPAGFLGGLPTDGAGAEDTDDEDDAEGGMEKSLRQDQDELDAEAAETSAGKAKRAGEAADEGTHNKRVDANAKMENNENHDKKSSNLPKMSRAVSFPRQVLPEIPSTKSEYHVVLIQEIGRVMQHLKSHPPRKYTFQEWAWYLRLIGEDEGNAEKHRKVEESHLHLPHLRHRKKAKETDKDAGAGEKDDGGGENKSEDGEAEEEKRKNKPWSWVGSHSPLMGSQEEAEWILEKLTERLKEELTADAESRKKGQRRRSTVVDW